MKVKSVIAIVILAALTLNQVAAQTSHSEGLDCTCEWLATAWGTLSALYTDTYQLSSFYDYQIPSAINGWCMALGAWTLGKIITLLTPYWLIDNSFLAETDAKNELKPKANRKASDAAALEPSFLETTQAVTNEDIANLLALPLFCIADIGFGLYQPEFVYYCQQAYYPFWYGTSGYFPESNTPGEDDSTSRYLYITYTENLFFAIYGELGCEF